MIRAIDIIDKLPQRKPFASRAAFLTRNRKALERAGYVAYRSVRDDSGDCYTCGEAGRCPGWHTGEETFRSFAIQMIQNMEKGTL